jgi:hypothetical protein
MGVFSSRKSGVDLIDFTKTRDGKRIPEPKADSPAPIVGGFLDFTQNTQPINQSNSSSVQPNSTEPSMPAGGFDFLNNFAQSASPSSSTDSNSSNVTSFFSNTDSLKNVTSEAEVNALKIKVNDLEYKLSRLLEKISEMESRVLRQ